MPKGIKGFQKGHTINVGIHRSEETKLKIGLAKTGVNNPHFGTQFSEETKEKMRKSSPHLSGENHPGWSGGIVRGDKGYILIYKPEHPFANNHGQVREHRLVMEEFLGRFLEPQEIVHHMNGIPDDNRIENLILFSNSSKHQKYHELIKKENQIAVV